VSQIDLRVDGRNVRVETGATVAAALLNDDVAVFRTSVTGSARGPLCGMGTCFECRVTIDGVPHRRACMTIAQSGMTVVTRG
jgi:D-hydroxyproline dehydrogenase subunit gamma